MLPSSNKVIIIIIRCVLFLFFVSLLPNANVFLPLNTRLINQHNCWQYQGNNVACCTIIIIERSSCEGLSIIQKLFLVVGIKPVTN